MPSYLISHHKEQLKLLEKDAERLSKDNKGKTMAQLHLLLIQWHEKRKHIDEYKEQIERAIRAGIKEFDKDTF
jgi:hypothetical protein